MHMQTIESSLISHVGYNPDQQLLQVRFRTKSGVPGALYQYGGVSPKLYEDGLTYVNPKTGERSFGSWFGKVIKPNDKEFPFRKLEDVGAVPVQGELPATDFASGQPLPATTAEVEVLPADPEELMQKASELQKKASMIQIVSAEAYELAAKTGMAIARMRDALEKTFRPGIDKAHKAWKAELAILNHYDHPLAADQDRLREGMKAYNRQKQLEAQREADRIRQEEQKKAELEAQQKADALKLADAIEAEDRGEVELRDQIMAAPALSIAPAYVPPVHVQVEVPKVQGSNHVEKWAYEFVDEKGNPVSSPRFDLIPREYLMVDEKAIGKVVRTLKVRTNIPGIRAYDEGNVTFSKK